MAGAALYRHWAGAADQSELLYVGISVAAMVRTGAHEQAASWWPQVRTITIEPHHNKLAAERAERAAIQAERPKYNRTHSTKPPEPRPPVAGQAKKERDKRLATKPVGWAPWDERLGERLGELAKLQADKDDPA